ncbi:MAG: DNA polymerase ligase N-terminal domain-containing protein [Dehalococcoidia bacterium]|nr:DNA polymerase ligase N-terminal domain-containing protein [Dehalococcoidia bacterium]
MEEYRKKRDFNKTTEPMGEIVENEERYFVVHRHQASHLHWDLRLEMDGVLKSWAVPKEPPLVPGVRRLAVQVEDHPLDYMDFQGTIPPGEYGAGTVEIWDKGTFELQKLEAGKIEFSVRGNKLQGGYILIHTGGKNWLFLKRKSTA